MNLELSETAVVTNINNSKKYHGEDRILHAAIDLTIEQMQAGELDQLAVDGHHYSNALWEQEADEDLVGGFKLGGPKLVLLKTPLIIDVEVENHRAEINVQGAEGMPKNKLKPIVIEPAKVRKFKFTPKLNGVVELSMQIYGPVNGHDSGIIAEKYLQEKASVLVKPSKDSQMDLDE